MDYVKQEGFTHVEFSHWPSTVLRLLGLPGHRLLCGRLPVRFPDDSVTWSTEFHQAGIGVIMDWVPAHFPKDALRARPLRRHPAVTRTWTSCGAANTLNGAPMCSTSDAAKYATSWWPTPCSGLRTLHVDALRADAVSSMLYLDYSREPGHWRPNIYGGRENLEAIDFLARRPPPPRTRTTSASGDRRGVHCMAAYSPSLAVSASA